MSKPNDRPDMSIANFGLSDDDPELIMIVKGNKFPRPGLETYFADSHQAHKDTGKNNDGWVVGSYCSCNKVKTCTCVPACSCAAHKSCSCVGHRSGGHGGGYGCRCAPVH